MAIYLGATELTTGGAATGGGSFTKQKIYSSMRAPTDWTDFKIFNAGATAQINGFIQPNSTYIDITNWASNFPMWGAARNFLAGTKVSVTDSNTGVTQVFTLGNGIQGATTIGAGAILYNVTPNVGVGINGGAPITWVEMDTATVNPASDLGLADNSQIGYFMVGGGSSGYVYANASRGGRGGSVLSGMATITTAATDLTLVIGYGGKATTYGGTGYEDGGESSISGGLTLTTANGTNGAGAEGAVNGGSYVSGVGTPGPGINGFGAGGRATDSGYGPGSGPNYGVAHGYGLGAAGYSNTNYVGSDGSIILYY